MFIGSKQMLDGIDFDTIDDDVIGNNKIDRRTPLRNLGVVFGQHMTFEVQIIQ